MRLAARESVRFSYRQASQISAVNAAVRAHMQPVLLARASRERAMVGAGGHLTDALSTSLMNRARPAMYVCWSS
jgi:hypothetical protein